MKESDVKHRLEDERHGLLEQIASINETGLSEGLQYSTSELSMYDNHPADLGDETFERSKDLAIRDSLGQMVKQIEHALDRLVEGRYGVCETCGGTIDAERLDAVPWATECIECREKSEAHDTLSTRPVEEDVLGVPFARTWTDGKDSTAYDGEDALQEATRYGTSETNQDYPGSLGPDDCFDDANELHGVVFPEEAYVAQDIEGHEFQMDPEPKKRRKNESVKDTR